jgi:hypothetical protein
MSNINLYATLADYKAFTTSRGQTTSTDTADDGVIKDLLENNSRYLDGESDRRFYPTIENYHYDIPENKSTLYINDDLLEVTTLTNGDATVIASTDYLLRSPNFTPYWGLDLVASSSVTWQADSNGNVKQVIGLLGVFGYCEKYAQRGWAIGGTLGAAITDTTTLAFTMTAGHTLAVGHIIKIGSELMNIDTVASNTITPIARGDNGSTAATHLNGTTVYIFRPDPRAKLAVLEQTVISYAQRFGKSVANDASVTALGVTISPRGLAKSMADLIDVMGGV